MKKFCLLAIGVPVAAWVANIYKKSHRKYYTIPTRRVADVL